MKYLVCLLLLITVNNQMPISPFVEEWPAIKENILNKKSIGSGIGIKQEKGEDKKSSKSLLEICLDNNALVYESCQDKPSCLKCALSVLCGWCADSQTCMPIKINSPQQLLCGEQCDEVVPLNQCDQRNIKRYTEEWNLNQNYNKPQFMPTEIERKYSFGIDMDTFDLAIQSMRAKSRFRQQQQQNVIKTNLNNRFGKVTQKILENLDQNINKENDEEKDQTPENIEQMPQQERNFAINKKPIQVKSIEEMPQQESNIAIDKQPIQVNKTHIEVIKLNNTQNVMNVTNNTTKQLFDLLAQFKIIKEQIMMGKNESDIQQLIQYLKA